MASGSRYAGSDEIPAGEKVLRGIRATHPTQVKQAKPLQLAQLEQLDGWLLQQISIATEQNHQALLLKCLRDRALLLIGFWRGFRSDELSRLQIEHITLVPGEGMEIYLPHTKPDREHRGTTFKAPALSRLCPVSAKNLINRQGAVKIINDTLYRREESFRT